MTEAIIVGLLQFSGVILAALITTWGVLKAKTDAPEAPIVSSALWRRLRWGIAVCIVIIIISAFWLRAGSTQPMADYTASVPLTPPPYSANAGARALIHNVWVEHDTFDFANHGKGMRIHVSLTLDNLRAVQCEVVTFVADTFGAPVPSTDMYYITNPGQLAIHKDLLTTITRTTWSDVDLFLPYSTLNSLPDPMTLQLSVQIIRNDTLQAIANFSPYRFTYKR